MKIVSKRVGVSTRPLRCEWTREMATDLMSFSSDWEANMERILILEMRKLERMKRMEKFLESI